MRIEADSAAMRTLERLVERSRRNTGVRLPATFVRGDGRKPMLSELLRGGRGGEVRLKLYLSTVLLAGSKHSHKIHGKNTIVDVSGPTWARALALPDSAAAGARRVADAQNQLASKRLIKVDRRPGQEPRVQLLHPSGSGGHWVEPGSPYVRIPLDLWTNRWIWILTGKELAVYMAILDLCSGRGRDGTGGPQALSGTSVAYYGMSGDTWRLGAASLERHGLIRTDMTVVRVDLESPRRRKRYQLVPDALSREALPT
jgi:hypothetical protein